MRLRKRKLAEYLSLTFSCAAVGKNHAPLRVKFDNFDAESIQQQDAANAATQTPQEKDFQDVEIKKVTNPNAEDLDELEEGLRFIMRHWIFLQLLRLTMFQNRN